MSRVLRFSLLAVSLLLACADDADGGERFPCGDHGGTCDRETEVCVVGGPDRCSTCVAKPATCDQESSCECLPPGSDPVFGAHRCVDKGMCMAAGGGMVVTCTEIEWGCG